MHGAVRSEVDSELVHTLYGKDDTIDRLLCRGPRLFLQSVYYPQYRHLLRVRLPKGRLCVAFENCKPSSERRNLHGFRFNSDLLEDQYRPSQPPKSYFILVLSRGSLCDANNHPWYT